MRALMIAAAIAALTCSVSAPGQAQTAQQALMKSCNTDAAAKKLTGDTRKSFMADCLAGKTQTSPATSTAAQTPQAAQQQKMKECNANATSQKLKGTARKDFMSSCLSGNAAAATPAAAPAAAPAAQAPAPSPKVAQQQKMKECNTTATSQKLKGTARKDFMSSCLSGTAAAPAPASSTAAAPASPPATAAKPEAPAATRTTATPVAPAQPRPSTSGSAPSTAALGPGQYATEAQAKSTCASDTVVWVNTDSHIYHFKTAADYGKTKQGAYMCEREAVAGGSRAAKNEKRS